jgi:aryl-alcohol dehydrogenase-like predicted oxidoreductase
MRSVSLGNDGMRSSTLGFGCSAVMGRIGRRASLAALGAAFDAGITFYDTARSYGYGESEALLGEFIRPRRDSVIISTKFGIVPAPANPLKQFAKPIARTALKVFPALRRTLQGHVAAQFSANHFTVDAMRSSVETSLRNLQTGYIDLLFLHLPPVTVLHHDDLFSALEQLHIEGKVLRYGIAADPPIALAALAAAIPGLQTIEFPCNLFDLSLANHPALHNPNIVAIANHPFGGPQRVAESKTLIHRLAHDPTLPPSLHQKLHKVDDATLADLVLNLITVNTGIKVVVPSMLTLAHLQTNIAALQQSRFTPSELQWFRNKLNSGTAAS